MNGITYKDYDCIEDIIEEILSTICGIAVYNIDNLEKDKLYLTGCINIIKLGDKPNTLKHLQDNKWSDDVEISQSYEYASYFDLDVIDKMVKEKLTRKFYYKD